MSDPSGSSGQSAVFSQGPAGGRGRRGEPGAQLWAERPPPGHRDGQRVPGRLPAAGGTGWTGDNLLSPLKVQGLGWSLMLDLSVARGAPTWTAAPMTAPPPSILLRGGALLS